MTELLIKRKRAPKQIVPDNRSIIRIMIKNDHNRYTLGREREGEGGREGGRERGRGREREREREREGGRERERERGREGGREGGME